MNILAVTNMYPSLQSPSLGTFVEQQIRSLKLIGLDIDILFVDRALAGVRAYLSLERKLRKMVAESNPDVVHVMYGGVMADVVTRSVRDRPIVVSFCGSDLLGETCSGFVRKLIAGYGVIASRRAASRAAGVVVKSKNLRDALPDTVNPGKIRVIPNGIDLELFKPLDRGACRRRLGWSANGFHVLFPANAGNPVKRYDLAFASIEAAKRRGIPAEIHQLRGIPHDEVPLWLNASDVVLLTSSHEGSPNVIKEALACDLPIVSVDVGDVRERLEKIKGCYIALPEFQDLGDKLTLVFADSRRIAGRVSVQELSLKHVALRLRKLYDELLISGIRTRVIKIRKNN
jgi:glycosyltransferase involved in cell wall biosynthesis